LTRSVTAFSLQHKKILHEGFQAVIRLSKKYLPGMAISYQHPKVKVHVGDGFKFLDDYKNEFDVIITDSSDPEGPAESLFQKPYFELLFGALKEGGVITTQGCTFSYVTLSSFLFGVLAWEVPRDLTRSFLTPHVLIGAISVI
jgi:spermidine synthase